MSEQTNIQRNRNDYDEYVRKLRSICDMHKVRFGSPADLPGFMQSLAENSHFAMDFWALTGAVSGGEAGKLSGEQTVAAIIAGIAGGAIPEPGREQKRIVNDLSRLLAGVDIHSPAAQSDAGRGPLWPPPPKRVFSSDAAGGRSAEPFSLPPAPQSQLDEVRSRLEHTQRAGQEPTSESVKEPVGRLAEDSRAVFEPNASRSDDSLAGRQDDPSVPRIKRYIIPTLVIALILAGGIFSMRERSSAPRGGESPASRQPPQNTAASPAPNAVSNISSPEQTVATPVAPQSAETKPDPNTPARVLGSRAAARETAVGEDLSPSGQTTAVKVAPAVMEANLVTSRVPVYPDIAKIRHIAGSVVMQVVISSDGTVTRVHVVEGDALLRDTSMEAVRKWRYRPYLVNGKPVDVETTITVDFDLDE